MQRWDNQQEHKVSLVQQPWNNKNFLSSCYKFLQRDNVLCRDYSADIDNFPVVLTPSPKECQKRTQHRLQSPWQFPSQSTLYPSTAGCRLTTLGMTLSVIFQSFFSFSTFPCSCCSTGSPSTSGNVFTACPQQVGEIRIVMHPGQRLSMNSMLAHVQEGTLVFAQLRAIMQADVRCSVSSGVICNI